MPIWNVGFVPISVVIDSGHCDWRCFLQLLKICHRGVGIHLSLNLYGLMAFLFFVFLYRYRRITFPQYWFHVAIHSVSRVQKIGLNVPHVELKVCWCQFIIYVPAKWLHHTIVTGSRYIRWGSETSNVTVSLTQVSNKLTVAILSMLSQWDKKLKCFWT